MWSIQNKTIQKFLQIHKKIKCHKQASRLLQPDQRQKQNHNRENLLVQQQPYQCTKEDGLTLSNQNKILLRTISRRKSLIFFDTIRRYSEKKMEQLNSARQNFIFEIIIHKYSMGLMIVGKLVWQQEENPNEDISITLINLIDPTLQDNVVIGSGVFHYIYHIGCAFNLHSIINNGLSRRQTVFFLPIDPRDTDEKDLEH